MSSRTRPDPRAAQAHALDVAAHALWVLAHARGETRNGRLLARGGRHADRRTDGARKACRGRPAAE